MSAAVVQLPTAAPRKVRQNWNKRTRAAREELLQFPKERSRFAFAPRMHKALNDARLILDADADTYAKITRQIFRTLSNVDQTKVAIGLALQVDVSESAKRALAVCEYEMGSNIHKFDVARCIDMLLEGEVE